MTRKEARQWVQHALDWSWTVDDIATKLLDIEFKTLKRAARIRVIQPPFVMPGSQCLRDWQAGRNDTRIAILAEAMKVQAEQ
jgi:hypothetical protein